LFVRGRGEQKSISSFPKKTRLFRKSISGESRGIVRAWQDASPEGRESAPKLC